MNFDIDFVVMWVDGSDPEWRALKARYTPESDSIEKDTENRYRDWGLMKYWFRAIEQYAPWVRKVHFITWGHVPAFLNLTNSKLNLVKHEDYLPADVLPTFNSEAIEMNIQRIPGLAEHFVFFNDDMFLNRPVSPDDFFDPETGNPKMMFSEIPLRFYDAGRLWEVVNAVNLGIVNKNFTKRDIPVWDYFEKRTSVLYPFRVNARNLICRFAFPSYYTGFKIKHGPAALLKSVFEEIWEKEPGVLERTTNQRFRELGDVNHWLVMMWQLASNRFEPKHVENAYFDTSEENIDEICNIIRNKSVETLCINDPLDLKDYQAAAQKIIDAFEDVFPYKSTFEL